MSSEFASQSEKTSIKHLDKQKTADRASFFVGVIVALLGVATHAIFRKPVK